jgi:protein MpaA
VHAPLTILDYDGPMRNNKNGVVNPLAKNLLLQMSRKANGYQIKDYPFYPGSLGNWAGNERGIPTYTLELPSSDNRKHRVFWKLFRNAIHMALIQDLRKNRKVALRDRQE